MLRSLIAVTVVSLFAGVAAAAEVKYDLDAKNTKITFVGTKKDGKHDGGFEKLTGSATVDGTDAATLKISLDIDLDSTFTDTKKLTDHLKSPDFFGVKNNPNAKFVTTKVEANKDKTHTISGKLTLNGKTKEINFPATIEAKDGTLNVTSSFKINRHDWGVSYGKGMVDDDVSLTIKLTAAKK